MNVSNTETFVSCKMHTYNMYTSSYVTCHVRSVCLSLFREKTLSLSYFTDPLGLSIFPIYQKFKN